MYNLFMKKTVNILIALMIIFILTNSSLKGESSGGLSLLVAKNLEVINPFSSFDFFHLFIRKLAHFTEYFVYGGLLVFAYKTKSMNHKLIIALALLPIFDETLQLFVAGRDGNIIDVLIDYSGMLCSFSFIQLINLFIKRM